MCEAHQQHNSTKGATPRSASGVTFLVSDMTCGHCAGVVTKALEQSLPGARFHIDLANSRVTIEGDAARAENAIRSAGYTPEPIAR